ncbi:MAG: cell division protein ZapA [Clostridiales bacterium]|nr:cell division protein ZapA [Clostridiales bacterium]
MEKNLIKINICGMDYHLSSDDDPAYLKSIAAETDEKIRKAMSANPHISTTQAAVLVALEYSDAYKKCTSSADNLRAQLKDYLEDAAKAKSERDLFKREVERLKLELQDKKGTSGLWG